MEGNVPWYDRDREGYFEGTARIEIPDAKSFDGSLHGDAYENVEE